jgi:hypothetical protein
MNKTWIAAVFILGFGMAQAQNMRVVMIEASDTATAKQAYADFDKAQREVTNINTLIREKYGSEDQPLLNFDFSIDYNYIIIPIEHTDVAVTGAAYTRTRNAPRFDWNYRSRSPRLLRAAVKLDNSYTIGGPG